MNRRITLMALLLTAVLLFGGCALQTVDKMYSLPKRSEEYNDLQSSIDAAMAGLEYSAPLSGENQQTVQMADLDGDGVDEYLLFAKASSDKPMEILIFSRAGESCQLKEIIESRGSAFELVEYVEMDDQAGVELVAEIGHGLPLAGESSVGLGVAEVVEEGHGFVGRGGEDFASAEPVDHACGAADPGGLVQDGQVEEIGVEGDGGFGDDGGLVVGQEQGSGLGGLDGVVVWMGHGNHRLSLGVMRSWGRTMKKAHFGNEVRLGCVRRGRCRRA